MIIKAFDNVDQYTMMSLCDVVSHACETFKEASDELAKSVAPTIVKHFLVTSEEQNNSIFSIIGIQLRNTNILDCLCLMVKALKSNVEPFASDILTRAIKIAMYILNQKAGTMEVIIEKIK